MTFSDNIHRICRERGTTLTALCKKLHLSTSKVTAWNNGSLPKESVMHLLAAELNCTVGDFFAEAPAQAVPADEDEADILRVYRALPRREKHAFMAQIYELEEHQKQR